MSNDLHTWMFHCQACQKVRARPATGPMRSISEDNSMRAKVPWSDVIVDVQGPYTTAEGGERYVLSYHGAPCAQA